MLGVVPVAEHDGELLVVRVFFGGRVDRDGCAQAVDVLALVERNRWIVSTRCVGRMKGEVTGQVNGSVTGQVNGSVTGA